MRISKLKNKKSFIIFFTLAAMAVLFSVFIFNHTSSKDKNYDISRLNGEERLQYLNSKGDFSNLKIIAHRGVCNNEPENTIASIKSSINHNVDYAEIDVQETKDGVVVLMHDKNLKRLTGVNTTVNRLTYNQIENLKIHQWFKGKYGQEPIPTLDEVIKLSNNRRKLIIEIKPYAKTQDVTAKVVDIIEKNNFTDQCMIHSISYDVLKQVKEENPNIITGYISSRKGERLPTKDVDFYSVNEKFITENMVKSVHGVNKTIYAWTVNDVINMDRAINLKVDGIITDKPTILLDIKKAKIHKI